MNNTEIQIESVIRQTEMGYTRSFIYLCYSNNHMIKTSSTVLFKQLIAEFLGATITKELGIDYSDTIKKLSEIYPHLIGRVFYIYDVPLPVLLRKGKGMVTINSTSGLSALLHNMPVITLGRANYDFEGLTYQGELNKFWQSPTPPESCHF